MLTQITCLALATFLLFTLTFLFAVVKRNNSYVDIIWGLGFLLLAAISYLYSDQALRQSITTIYVVIWGLRLAVHIYSRNRGKPEDFRYATWRKDWGSSWVIRSFTKIYLLQWVLMLLISIPIIITNLTPSSPLGYLDYLGIVIWWTGFLFEAIGDYQLKKFKKNKRNKGKLMTTGLWSLTRHPNYFGEATLWWGIALMSFSQSHNLLVFVGPIVIDFLLLKVSGIPLLEKKYQERKDWQQYAAQTPPFWPRLFRSAH